MYAASVPIFLVLLTSCVDPARAFVAKSTGANREDTNGDDTNFDHTDANTDSWDTKASPVEMRETEASRPTLAKDSSEDDADGKARQAEEEPSPAARAAFVEPPTIRPPPKTWNDLTPAQQQALKQRYMMGQWANAFFTWVIWTVLGVLVGLFVYNQKTVEQDEKVSASDEGGPVYEFQNGHCACLEDLESCACACLCPALRWSDTLQQAGFTKFWLAFLLYTFLALLNCLHWGKLWAGLFTAFGICIFRQRLRSKIGLDAWDLRGCCLDYCFSLWCPCCAIAQEARVVQAMQRCGHESLEQSNAES